MLPWELQGLTPWAREIALKRFYFSERVYDCFYTGRVYNMLPWDVYGVVSRVNKITSMSICILDASLWLSEGMNSITPSHTFL